MQTHWKQGGKNYLDFYATCIMSGREGREGGRRSLHSHGLNAVYTALYLEAGRKPQANLIWSM